MFHDDFEQAWQILRGEGTVHDSQHVNVTLWNGSILNDALLYDRRINTDDNGTVLSREAVFLVDGNMRVIPIEDIVGMKLL